MTTMPAVSPGDPVVHIAVSKPEQVRQMEMDLHKLDSQSLERRLRSDLATNVHVVNLEDMW
jgi:hypothetical protein